MKVCIVIAASRVLTELCQRSLIEAVRFNAFFKDNTELGNQFLPIISGRLPLDLHVQ